MIINYFPDNDFTITKEHDNLIISLLTMKNKDNKTILNSCRLKEHWLKSRNIYNYIINRYKNISNLQEILYLLINHYDEKPQYINCKTCGKQIIPKFKSFFDNGYKQYCSYKCSINDKNKTYKVINNLSKNEITDETIINHVYDKDKNKLISSHLSVPHLKSMNYYDYIINRYNDNSNFKSLTQEVIYRMMNHIDVIPKCPICGNSIHFKRFTDGYRKYCSHSCALKSDERKQQVINKRQKTKENKWLNQGYNIKYLNKDNFIIYNNCSKHKSFIIKKYLFYGRIRESNKILCTLCNPERNKETSIETIIKNILDKYNINYIQHTRLYTKPKELDFYINDYNIAIECNGIFWHHNKKDLTKFKYEKCKTHNINLLTLWEDTIKYKDLQIDGYLKNIFNKNNIIISQNYYIKEITTIEAKNFINTYNINEYKKSNIKIGIFISSELVYVMTFNKFKDNFIINQFVNKYDFNIINCLENILSFSKKLLNTDIYLKSNNELIEDVYFKNINKTFIKNLNINYTIYNYKLSKFRLNKNLNTNLSLFKCYDAGYKLYKININ